MDPRGGGGVGGRDAAHSSSTNGRRRNRTRRRRARPNVLITGTPGTGKTALATLLSEQLDLRHVNVGDIIKAHKCYEGRDEALDTFVLDEDKLLDVLEPLLEDYRQNNVGVVLDYHSCDFFPERYFDLVLVLQCETDVLYDRLTSRNYSELKRSENVTAEIMQVILEEAKQSYDPNIVHAVPSNTLQDMDSNVDRVRSWMDQWMRDHGGGDGEDDATGSSDDGGIEDAADDDDIST